MFEFPAKTLKSLSIFFFNLPSLFICFALPRASVYGGTSSVITEPAPV